MNVTYRGMRDDIENKVTKEMPDKTPCIMSEVDRKELLDVILQIGYTERNTRISENERKVSVDALETIGEEKLKTVATACGVDAEKLKTIFTDL